MLECRRGSKKVPLAHFPLEPGAKCQARAPRRHFRIEPAAKGLGLTPAPLLCCRPASGWLPQSALVSSARCDAVFKGFSDCLLQLGDNMANYPADLDDQQNLHKICT